MKKYEYKFVEVKLQVGLKTKANLNLRRSNHGYKNSACL